jgi:hypothetical protein
MSPHVSSNPEEMRRWKPSFTMKNGVEEQAPGRYDLESRTIQGTAFIGLSIVSPMVASLRLSARSDVRRR